MSFNKAAIFKWSLFFLIALSCITDVATFFWSGLYEFEINPIVVNLKNSIGFGWAIALAVLVKCTMVGYMAWMIVAYKPKPESTHLMAYLIVFLCLFIIALQVFGTYANITTTIAQQADPVNVQPMSAEESTKILNVANIIFYIITSFSLLAFWIYENIFRISVQSNSSNTRRRRATSP